VDQTSMRFQPRDWHERVGSTRLGAGRGPAGLDTWIYSVCTRVAGCSGVESVLRFFLVGSLEKFARSQRDHQWSKYAQINKDNRRKLW
jgi:hypothetical protein